MKLRVFPCFMLSCHIVFLLINIAIAININSICLLLIFYSLVITFFVPIWIFGVFLWQNKSYLGQRVLGLAQRNDSNHEYNLTGINNIQYELRNGRQTLRPLPSKLWEWCLLNAKAVAASITRFYKSLKSIAVDISHFKQKADN